MGWTGIYETVSNRREFLDREFTWKNDENGAGCTVVRSAMVGTVYYAAVRRTFPAAEARAPIVFGLVTLTQSSRGEFRWKDMDESMGPCESNCPESILDLLSPLEPDARGYANDWRARCRENAAKRRTWKKVQPKPGQRVRFAEPIKFTDGFEAAEFTFTKITRRGRQSAVWIGSNGGYYRVTNANKRAFEIVDGAP